MATNRDVYGQFFPLSVTAAAAANTFVSNDHSTGLSIRGGHLWQIHAVHFELAIRPAATCFIELAISTRRGLLAMPTVADAGVLAKRYIDYLFVTSGAALNDLFFREDFLPPVPLVAPNLSMCVDASADDVSLRNVVHHARILFTTAPVSAQDYAEIAEVWAQAE